MFNSILKDIKNNIHEHCTPIKFIIIGSNKDGIINKTDLDIIHLLRQGLSKERISKKKNFSRMTLHRRLKKIVATVMDALQV